MLPSIRARGKYVIALVENVVGAVVAFSRRFRVLSFSILRVAPRQPRLAALAFACLGLLSTLFVLNTFAIEPLFIQTLLRFFARLFKIKAFQSHADNNNNAPKTQSQPQI